MALETGLGELSNYIGGNASVGGNSLLAKETQFMSSAEKAIYAPNMANLSAETRTSRLLGEDLPTQRWRLGDDVYKPTANGKPSWTTVRNRYWKNEANEPTSEWTDAQLARMHSGRAPQRYNAQKGGMESMELRHEPVPYREGGHDFVARWPCEHAAIDPFRTPGYC